jgi:hypothetical protein
MSHPDGASHQISSPDFTIRCLPPCGHGPFKSRTVASNTTGHCMRFKDHQISREQFSAKLSLGKTKQAQSAHWCRSLAPSESKALLSSQTTGIKPCCLVQDLNCYSECQIRCEHNFENRKSAYSGQTEASKALKSSDLEGLN